MVQQRAKGKRGELELRNLLRKHGYETAKRTAMLQTTTGSEAADVSCDQLPIWWECKRTEKCQPRAFLAQACKDCDKESLPVVCHKANHQPWTAILLAEDLLFILKHCDVTALSEAIRSREAE
jgi:hypothetical protein